MISRIYCNRHCYKFSDFDEVTRQLKYIDAYLKQNIRSKSIIDREQKRYYELKLELRLIIKEAAGVEKLSQQEREYVKSHEESFQRDKIMMQLIELWTDKDRAAEGHIIATTPKGSDWRMRLVDESSDHMLTIIK